MPPLQPLQILLEQAAAERDQALAAHQRARAAAQAAEAQAEQLRQYRGEYVQRFGGRFSRAGAVELLQCYQGFMARLDDAVAQQAQAMRQSVARAEAAQAALLTAELRVASVGKLIERRVAEAGLAQERRDQKATDEFASRAAWQRLAAAGPDALGLV
jgi:flagellar FliJ protein